MARANALSFPLQILAFVLFFYPYLRIHGEMEVSSSANPAAILPLAVVLFLVGLLAHEGLHAVGFRLAGRVPWKDIGFGFNRRALIPYTHCRVPVAARAFRVAGLLPAVILGVVPGVMRVAAGNVWLTVWGALFTAAASGDFLALWIIRGVPSSARVLDHPTEIGCTILPD